MTTTHRHRAGQAIPDDGSCWRHLAERQQATGCTGITFNNVAPNKFTACPAPLDHTNSAALIGDAGDSHPGPIQMYGPERMRAPGWMLFVVGVACGAAACAWVMLP